VAPAIAATEYATADWPWHTVPLPEIVPAGDGIVIKVKMALLEVAVPFTLVNTARYIYPFNPVAFEMLRVVEVKLV
jgi:hypothetical protein